MSRSAAAANWRRWRTRRGGRWSTVERVTDVNLLEDERLAAGTIAATYIEAVAIAERGCWPFALLDEYPADAAHLAEYARMARSDEGFQRLSATATCLLRPARAAAE